MVLVVVLELELHLERAVCVQIAEPDGQESFGRDNAVTRSERTLGPVERVIAYVPAA